MIPNNYKQQLLSDFNHRKNYDNGRFYIPIANRLIEFADLQNGQKILDIATGTGKENAFPPSVLFREVAKIFGINIPNPNEPIGTIDRCNQLLQEIGFKNIQVETEQFGWYFPLDEKIAEDIWLMNAKNVFGYQVFQLPPNKLEECKAEYIKEMQNLAATEKGVWCDARIFFVSAIK